MRHLGELLLALAVIDLLAMLWMSLRSAAVTREVCLCPSCGARMELTPEPGHSRLAARCRKGSCGQAVLHPVRPSALSLFGLNQLLLAVIAGAAGLLGGQALELARPARVVAGAVAFIVGFAVARFLIRLVAFAILRSGAPPIWQREAVAHLAPPPFR